MGYKLNINMAEFSELLTPQNMKDVFEKFGFEVELKEVKVVANSNSFISIKDLPTKKVGFNNTVKHFSSDINYLVKSTSVVGTKYVYTQGIQLENTLGTTITNQSEFLNREINDHPDFLALNGLAV